MQLRLAQNCDIPQLKRLWKQAFGDSEAYIDRFFTQVFPHAVGFVVCENGAAAAMAYALPVQVCCGEDARPAAYLYAVATDKRHRGRGFFRALMAYAEQTLQTGGCACVLLVPADEALAKTYEKMGYRGEKRHTPAVFADRPCGICTPVTAEQYLPLREEYLRHTPHVRYPEALLKFEGDAAHFFALQLDGVSGCCAALPVEDGAVRIEELLPDARLLPALAAGLPAQRYLLAEKKGVMCKWLTTPVDGWASVQLGFDFG